MPGSTENEWSQTEVYANMAQWTDEHCPNAENPRVRADGILRGGDPYRIGNSANIVTEIGAPRRRPKVCPANCGAWPRFGHDVQLTSLDVFGGGGGCWGGADLASPCRTACLDGSGAYPSLCPWEEGGATPIDSNGPAARHLPFLACAWRQIVTSISFQPGGLPALWEATCTWHVLSAGA